MPGISESYSMVAHANIRRALEDTFKDPESFKDAFKVYELLGKAHIWEDVMLEAHISMFRSMFRVFSLFIVGEAVLCLFVRPSSFIEMFPLWIFSFLVAILTVLEPGWSARRIKSAKDELNRLAQQKPEYWEPLITRVKEIVIIHGNAKHSLLGSKQVTRLKDAES